MENFNKKIAYLTSLITQIKEYSIEELNTLINMKELEELLDTPEVSDRKWENEPIYSQKIFSHFLNTYIDSYERIIKMLKEKVKLPL